MSCSHDCSNCKDKCEKESFIEKQNEFSSVKKVIGIVSGKGGVGKSLVTSLLATAVRKKGLSVAVLDADITGPSIPKIFGIKDKASTKDGKYILPVITESGIKIMSINLLIENDTDPVVWRGPVIAGCVKQFWTDVIWEDVDYMFVDMPPGTGDVPLTVFQSLPVDGIIVVTSPQELVSMIVGKAVKMAELMNIPILGIVENLSYFVCPDCGKKYSIFGESNVENISKSLGIDTVVKLPIDSELTKFCDRGQIESYRNNFVDEIVDKIIKTQY